MKRVFVMFVFAVMIGSLVSVSAQLGQTGSNATTSKNYILNECVTLEKGLAQKISDITMGLAQKTTDTSFPLLLGGSGTAGAVAMFTGAVGVGMGFLTVATAIPVMIIGGGLVYYSYRLLRTAAESIGTVSSEDDCYSSVALSTVNSALCQKVLISSTKDSCYLNLALKKNDFSLCEKISPYSNPALWDVCYYKAAMQTKDVALCEKLSTLTMRAESPLHIICVENFAKKV